MQTSVRNPHFLKARPAHCDTDCGKHYQPTPEFSMVGQHSYTNELYDIVREELSNGKHLMGTNDPNEIDRIMDLYYGPRN